MTARQEEVGHFRAEYGLTDSMSVAIDRWRETLKLQAQQGERVVGESATLVRDRLHEESLQAYREHEVANADLSQAKEDEQTARDPASRAVATSRRTALERVAEDTWSLFQQRCTCVEVLSSTYAHFDDELNKEHRAIALALDGVRLGMELLEESEQECASKGILPWYRRLRDGRPGIDESLVEDPRAHVVETRKGADPMVVLLIVRHLLERFRVVSPESERRPEKAGLQRVVALLAEAGVGTAETCRVLADIGYSGNDVRQRNLRRLREKGGVPP